MVAVAVALKAMGARGVRAADEVVYAAAGREMAAAVTGVAVKVVTAAADLAACPEGKAEGKVVEAARAAAE